MNTIVYFYLLIIVLCWTLNPFIKKKMLGKFTTDEYFIINHFFITLLIIVYFYYLYTKKLCKTNCLKKINMYDIIYILLGAITSILGARLLISLIKFQEVSFLVAHIQPLVIALSFIIGYMFFSESMSLYKIIGGSLIILGLILINKKNI